MVSSSSTVQPVASFAWMAGRLKPSPRPLVWLRICLIVIRWPLGTPAIHFAMRSSRATLPSPTSRRMRLAVKVLVWLAILNCMSLFSRRLVARSAKPVAVTNLPLGDQMATRTPGVRFVSRNRRTISRSVACVRAGSGSLAARTSDGAAAPALIGQSAVAPVNSAGQDADPPCGPSVLHRGPPTGSVQPPFPCAGEAPTAPSARQFEFPGWVDRAPWPDQPGDECQRLVPNPLEVGDESWDADQVPPRRRPDRRSSRATHPASVSEYRDPAWHDQHRHAAANRRGPSREWPE